MEFILAIHPSPFRQDMYPSSTGQLKDRKITTIESKDCVDVLAIRKIHERCIGNLRV
jgi:hypothetical protein